MNQLQKDFWAQEHGFRKFSHPVVECFSMQRVDFLKDFISNYGNISRILDVGAGEGFSSFYLQEICRNVTATDFSEKMLRNNPVLKKSLADVHALPFKDNSFDMVCAWEVLHHLDNHKAAVEEVIRVSKKYICVYEVNRNNPVQFLYAFINKEHRGIINFSMKYLLNLFDGRVRIIKHATVGTIFPNKTPSVMLPLLSKLPFVVPFVGISNLIICEKT